jgi:hypothetical protein
MAAAPDDIGVAATTADRGVADAVAVITASARSILITSHLPAVAAIELAANQTILVAGV